ncbi:MAG: helix-turn-helix domain-containing protein [Christensenellaceae bacterium]|nr:helix-turn-helix domain-containing protein [Christensenellaceae bacterium]
MLKLNKAIKRLRTEYKLNQNDFDKIVGYTNTTISAYEKKTRESSHVTLSNFADYFNVS